MDAQCQSTDAVILNDSPNTFNFGKVAVRTYNNDGEIWFVAADVCAALEIVSSRQVVSRLDDDEKGVCTIYTPGGRQETMIISESGLYSLILTSRKEEARRFKRWVTHDVLPSIRKTGQYRKNESSSEVVATRYADAARIAPELMEILRSFNLTAETANSIAIEQLRIETGLHLLSAFKAAKANQETPVENLRWIEAEATRIVAMIPDDAVAMTHSFLENLIGITDNLPVKQ